MITRTIKQALRIAGQALRKRTVDAKAAVEAQTTRVLRVVRQVVAQTAQRMQGITSIPDRLVPVKP